MPPSKLGAKAGSRTAISGSRSRASRRPAAALVLLVAVIALVPAPPPRSRARVDLGGAVLVASGLASLLLAISDGLGYSVTSTGLLLVPMALGSIVAVWIAGRVVDDIGPRVLMALPPASVLAVGFCVTAIISVVCRAAPLDNTSAAVAVHAVVRTSGIAVGTAATAAIITGAGLIGPLPAESGYTDAFLMGAIASGCALLASPLLPGRR